MLLGMTFLERFWSKVEITDTCWLWTGHLNKKGKYGHIRTGLGESKVVAHRFAWEFTNQIPVPVGLELDHLCRVRICVNPAHLEPVTHKVNILRGNSPSACHARKTHCSRGHSLSTDGDVYIHTKGGRVCRICRRESEHRYYARQQAILGKSARRMRRNPLSPPAASS